MTLATLKVKDLLTIHALFSINPQRAYEDPDYEKNHISKQYGKLSGNAMFHLGRLKRRAAKTREDFIEEKLNMISPNVTDKFDEKKWRTDRFYKIPWKNKQAQEEVEKKVDQYLETEVPNATPYFVISDFEYINDQKQVVCLLDTEFLEALGDAVVLSEDEIPKDKPDKKK